MINVCLRRLGSPHNVRGAPWEGDAMPDWSRPELPQGYPDRCG